MTVNIDEAIEALLAYRQADMEGVEVLTSRQAIHEVADELRRLRGVAQSSADIDDLIERCKEVLDWHKTGRLHKGSGGRLRALANRLEASGLPDYYALSLAEKQTADAAMEIVAERTFDVAQAQPQCSAASDHAKVADWLDDQSRIATNSLHCGDNSVMIQQAHDWASRLEAAARHLRAVPHRSEDSAMLNALDDLKIHAIEDGSNIVIPKCEWDSAFRRLRGQPQEGQVTDILAAVRPHIKALSVTDDNPEYKSLLAKIDAALALTRPQSK